MTRSAAGAALAVTLAVHAWAGGAAARETVRVSIDEALHIAQPASPSVAVARSVVQRAQALITVARSELFPQLFGNASYTRTIDSEFQGLFSNTAAAMGAGAAIDQLPFGRPNAWRAGASFSQLLFSGGRVSSSIDLAEAGAAEAEVELTSARAQSVLLVAQGYYDALLSQQLVVIAEETLAQAEEVVTRTQAAYAQGVQPEYDVLRAEVSRDNQRALLVRQRAARDIAFAELHRLLGIPFDTPLDLTSTLDSDDDATVSRIAAKVAEVIPRTARAPVAQAREVVNMQRASLGIARSQWWPQISLVSDFGFVQYPLDIGPDDSDWRRNFTIGVVLSIPIFTGSRIEGNVRAAKADVAIAESRLLETIDLAAVDELTAREQVSVAQANLAASRRTVEQAERAHEIARVRFEQGVSTQLELVDARILLERARADRAEVARDLRVARIRMALLPALPLSGAAQRSAAAGAPAAAGATVTARAPAAAAATAPAAPAAPQGGAP